LHRHGLYFTNLLYFILLLLVILGLLKEDIALRLGVLGVFVFWCRLAGMPGGFVRWLSDYDFGCSWFFVWSFLGVPQYGV